MRPTTQRGRLDRIVERSKLNLGSLLGRCVRSTMFKLSSTGSFDGALLKILDTGEKMWFVERQLVGGKARLMAIWQRTPKFFWRTLPQVAAPAGAALLGDAFAAGVR